MDCVHVITDVCMRLKGAVLLRHGFIASAMAAVEALVVSLRICGHETRGKTSVENAQSR